MHIQQRMDQLLRQGNSDKTVKALVYIRAAQDCLERMAGNLPMDDSDPIYLRKQADQLHLQVGNLQGLFAAPLAHHVKSKEVKP